MFFLSYVSSRFLWGCVLSPSWARGSNVLPVRGINSLLLPVWCRYRVLFLWFPLLFKWTCYATRVCIRVVTSIPDLRSLSLSISG